MNQIDLAGRHALITGGGSGIGYATAERFLRSGAVVRIWGRDGAKLDRAVAALAPLGRIDARSVDVSDAQAVQAGVEAFLQLNGRVDVLFNNAGVVQPTVPMQDLSVAEWHRNIAGNLDSVFYGCRAVLPAMLKSGFGRIINNASMAGKEGNAFQSAYAAAKAGVISLTKSLGKELATSGVTVNCIVPTLFDTPLANAVTSATPEVFAAIRDKIPMKRIGRAVEAASLVAWIASEDCSFTTGFAFDLSGGRAVY